MLQFASVTFDASAEEIFGALLSGAALVLRTNAWLAGSREFWALCGSHGVTAASLPTMFWQQLCLDIHEAIPACVRLLIIGGEAVSQVAPPTWFGRPGYRPHLLNTYGPTETAINAAMGELEEAPSRWRSIGRPISNTRIYILDGHGEPVPIGVAGEIYIGGMQVARGYLNRPELTAERFVADPFAGEPGARMYKTGDLGRWLADGNIEFLGRTDFQVKMRGFRIELGEIEARLSEHAGVREAVVVAREDSPGDKRLAAYWTGNEELSAEGLRAHLAASLPDYMVPAAYMRLDALPLTPNGKLDRKALPAPEGAAFASRGYEAPRGEAEETLARLWAELLKVERVGRHDNFFELGGHSLLAVTLIERMRREGLEADVRTLFTAPSLIGLAAAVSRGTGVEVPANLIPEGCCAITPAMLPLIELSQAEIDGIAACVPGGCANIQDIYPLAPLQEGLLFHHLLGGEGDAYLLSSLLAFDGRARLEGFLAALQAVIGRHDILRTAVLWEGLSQPVQVVWREAPLAVEEVELDPAGGAAAAQLRARFDPRRTRLDVRRAPLMRAAVAHDRTQNRWLLLLQNHHLAMDHTTFAVLAGEVLAHVAGEAARLPAPVPFRNFVAQARLGVSLEEHEAFFRGMLGDVEEPSAPFGLLDVQGDGSEIEEARVALPAELAGRLRKRARALGVSAASLFHLAFGLVVARASGRAEAVSGTVLFGRMQGGADVGRAVGMFINTLPIRLPAGDEGAEAAVRRVHGLLAELLRHEHAPLALAQRCSGVPAPAPLFTALLNYRHSGGGGAEAGAAAAWEGVRALGGEERTNYPLTLSVDDFGEAFALTAQTPPEVGAARVCAFMLTALEGLAAALEQAPDTPLRSIGVLPEAERHRVVVEWNATDADYPSDKCIHELFEAQAEKAPDAVAVVYEGRQLTYGELNAQANRLAHHLRGLGVKPDDRVAICVERSIGLVAAELAILKCGAAYVPLDPGFPVERLAFMLGDCEAALVLTAGNTPLPVGLSATCVRVDEALLRQGEAGNPGLHLNSAAIAYIMYTSGSTGTPKGVEIPHRAIGRLVLNNGYADFSASDRVAFASNPAFDAATMEVWAPLFNGGRIVIIGQDAVLDPVRFGRTLEREGVSVLWLTAGLFHQYSDVLGEAFGRLRYLLAGGDVLDPRIVGRVLRRSPPQHLLNGYGPTETTTFALTHEIGPVADGAASIPLGRPISNTRIYILDGHGEPVPIGVAGELYIGGAGVARGYLNRPELTAERFVADPFAGEPGARMYKTGDLGRWLADGNIEFLGRTDFQVKVRGFRIELGEIEARLSEHAGVREAVVVAREDSPGDKRLAAYWTGNEELSAEGLRAHLAASLPDYMVPAAYMRLDALPLTPNGKLDRKALPAPEGAAFASRGYEAPRGEAEETLARLWAELLKVERVGRHDNFFELGGHSLLAVTLISKLKQNGMKVSLTQLFAHPTIKAVAQQVTLEDRSFLDLDVVPFRTKGDGTPLFLVHEISGEVRYGHELMHHIDADIPIYGLTGEPPSEISLRTVQGMATRFVQAIRAVQPAGPYRIAGWSFGGMLAYEIAAQLTGEDEKVEFLGLLDTYREVSITDFPQQDAGLLHKIIEAWYPTQAIAGELTAAADFSALVRKYQESGLLPEHFSIEEIRAYLFRIRLHYQAGHEYEAHPIPVPIYLLSAQQGETDDASRGWGAVAPEGLIHIIPVPGNHKSMMEKPHIASLGAAISRTIHEIGASRAVQEHDNYSPLVMVQKGRRGTAPMICLPGAGGNAISFVSLAAALGEEWFVYGGQPRGLDGLDVPHSTVPAAARAYLRALEENCPDGPVHLLGHSFGGWVAFEMALRLRAAGREVVSLTLVDSESPGGRRAVGREFTRAEALMKLVEIWELTAERPLGVALEDLAGRDAGQQLALLHERLVQAGLMPPRSMPDALAGTARTFETAIRTGYQPKSKYPGPVRLVLLPDPRLDDETNRKQFAEAVGGWRDWAQDLEEWRGPGNHMTALKPPHVTALAGWVRAGTQSAGKTSPQL